MLVYNGAGMQVCRQGRGPRPHQAVEVHHSQVIMGVAVPCISRLLEVRLGLGVGGWVAWGGVRWGVGGGVEGWSGHVAGRGGKGGGL